MDTIHFEALPLPANQLETLFIDNLVKSFGVTRRAAFAVMSNSSQHYYDTKMTDESGEALLSIHEPLSDYIKLLQSHVEIMESARARLLTILSYHFENEHQSGVE